MDLTLIQILTILVIFTWGFWRIFSKIGHSPWWACFMLIPLVGFVPIGSARGFVLIVLPLVLAVLMFWVVAFIRWPRFDRVDHGPSKPGTYDPPPASAFRGRFRRLPASLMPKRGPRGITRAESRAKPRRRRDDQDR